MSLTEHPLMPSSSSVVASLQPMILLLILPWPSLVMTSSPFPASLWRRGNRVSANDVCRHSEMADGGLTARFTGLTGDFTGLRCLFPQVPVGFSNLTIRLFLDKNLLSSLPADSFSNLLVLDDLDLSHNQLSSLEAGCFRGLASSLHFLDLSSNRLSTLDPAVLGRLQAQTNLTNNRWHCDCRMQLSMSQLDLDPASLSEVVCQSSDLPNLGAVGMPLVLLGPLCLSVRRTTDAVMLVTMFLWFSTVICYLVYYVRQNQEDACRHMQYLKALQSFQL
ncbi:hypothetical protein L3Q82_013779 [Scortum barcoo]|uniref:Uncharacterized protein n=1 Tax=Scortum barcoo TaxID=214431 RepID=A0ACB8VVE2_9TELE|nr:hypothetical protein L3Q82_013779 [Scortum barcoo]